MGVKMQTQGGPRRPLSNLTFKRSRGRRRPCINLDFITGSLSRQPEGSRSNPEQRERSWLPEKGCSLSEHLPRLKTCEPSLAIPRDLKRLPKAVNLYEINLSYVRRYLKCIATRKKTASENIYGRLWPVTSMSASLM